MVASDPEPDPREGNSDKENWHLLGRTVSRAKLDPPADGGRGEVAIRKKGSKQTHQSVPH